MLSRHRSKMENELRSCSSPDLVINMTTSHYFLTAWEVVSHVKYLGDL